MELEKFTFSYSRKEIIEAFQLHYKKIYRVKPDVIISILLIILGTLFWYIYGYEIIWFVLILCAVILLLIISFAYFLIPRLVYDRGTKYKDTVNLFFSSDKIDFSTENVASQLAWSLYKKVIEDENFYLLYYGKNLFTIIPKRIFRNEEEKDNFNQILQEKLPSVS